MTSVTPHMKSWSLLAYTVADDKGTGGAIDSAARKELEMICEAADLERVSVAAQVDFKHSRGAFRGVISEVTSKAARVLDADAKRYPLWQSIVDHLRRSTLSLDVDHTELDAASAGVLQAFMRFGRRACPAHRHMIYFYGHAYGPMGLFFDSAAKDRSAHTLRLNDLADALESSDDKAAVVLFRDCFMNTLETAYQLKDVADFMIASQSEAPIAGIWPWKKFLAELKPALASDDIAGAVAKHLGAFLDEEVNRTPFVDVPIALLDLRAAAGVTVPLTDLVDALEAARGDAACAQALEHARVGYPDAPSTAPGDPALIDVPTMCDNLQRVGVTAVANAARALNAVVADRLVTWHHSQKKVYKGTSLYYKPVRADDIKRSCIQQEDAEAAATDAAAYKQLALNQATGWHRIALHPLALPAAHTRKAPGRTAQTRTAQSHAVPDVGGS